MGELLYIAKMADRMVGGYLPKINMIASVALQDSEGHWFNSNLRAPFPHFSLSLPPHLASIPSPARFQELSGLQIQRCKLPADYGTEPQLKSNLVISA